MTTAVAEFAACPLDQLLACEGRATPSPKPEPEPEPESDAAVVFCLSTPDIDPDVLFEVQRMRGRGVVEWPERIRIRIHPKSLHLWDDDAAATLCLFRMSSRDPGFYAICGYLWLLQRVVASTPAPADPPAA